MSIKISATKVDLFSKIEVTLSKFDKDFIKKFDTAEYAVEGFSDIQLVSTYHFNEKIKLPKGFSIEEIENREYSEYEKDFDGNIKENPKYRIIVKGTFENQTFILIYLNIVNMNISVGFN
ncbi:MULTISPECIES: hypothetical protein [Clostridium]|uniref:Uncharacterized protein n=1 Tax=Clostridium sporogenes TaxID=1509 RepID=A0A1L3NF95_CLOSG|nr:MULTISPECIES: hypothetical protein [Clostridium]APH14787.1 hypothetical protein NPD5_3912 [Clostridium sporogenes]MBD5639477.1 hypothetical protein [Clostridium botulinum]MDI6918977.1 hypothetical protein [Clostridium botulinum]WMU99805.1 hypothetical protein QA656_19420 [Clostridium botulinum]